MGSIFAIFAAAGIAWWQYKLALRAAREEKSRSDREHLKRLIAGLKAEVCAALEMVKAQQVGLAITLKAIDEARGKGLPIKESQVTPGSMTISDAVVYQQVAADVGRLPSTILEMAVSFYSRASSASRVAEGAPNSEQSYRLFKYLLSRVGMNGAMLVRMLDKFAAADFSDTADLQLTRDEAEQAAKEVGYPLSELAREAGLHL